MNASGVCNNCMIKRTDKEINLAMIKQDIIASITDVLDKWEHQYFIRKREEAAMEREYVDGTNPLSGDLVSYNCPDCLDNELVLIEFGDAQSDVSEFGLFCDNCELEIQPDEMEDFCESSSSS
tara:strand:- start:4727 stop:5095 length:369 start_codon:yes stop_codon:yes gene_type:complete